MTAQMQGRDVVHMKKPRDVWFTAGRESSVEVQRATAVLARIISWGMPRSRDRRAPRALRWPPPFVILEFILRRSSECDGNV